MRLTVDLDLCEGNALCVQTAPGLFTLGDDDKVVITTSEVPARDEERALLAVHMCPKQALAAD